MNTFVMTVSTSLRRCNHFQRLQSIPALNAKALFEKFTTMSGLFLRVVVFIKPIPEHRQLPLPLQQKQRANLHQRLRQRVNCDEVVDHF